MRKLLCMVVLVLVGCDPAQQWNGTFAGAVVTTISCSNGKSGTNSDALTMSVKEAGGSILLNDNGPCADYTAALGADVTTASLNPKVCPRQPASGGYVEVDVAGGSASIAGNMLTSTFNESITVWDLNGAVVGTCTGKATGTLQRQ